MADRHRWVFVVLAGWLALWPLVAPAHAQISREYQIKAAFVYHFVQFVEWPAGTFSDDRAPIIVVVLGSDPSGGEFDRAMAGKSIGGRRLVMKHVPRASDIQQCQVLLVPAASDAQLAPALERLGRGAVLTIGETDRFLQEGGIIRFYEEENRVRFEINQEAAGRARLRISAKLLRLAKPRGS